jgi:hypothetical protein
LLRLLLLLALAAVSSHLTAQLVRCLFKTDPLLYERDAGEFVLFFRRRERENKNLGQRREKEGGEGALSKEKEKN